MFWKIDQPDLIIFLGWTIFHNLRIYYQKFKIRNSSAAAVEFWIMLSISTCLIPKLKIRPRQQSSFEIGILLSIITY